MSQAKAKQNDAAESESTSAKQGKEVNEGKGLGKEIKIGVGVIGLLAVVLVALVIRRLNGPQSPPTAAIPSADDLRAEELLNGAAEKPTFLPATSAVDLSQPYPIDATQPTPSWQTSPSISETDAATSRHLMPQQSAAAGNGTGIDQPPTTGRVDSYDLPSRYSAPINDGLNTIPTPSYRDSTAIEAMPGDARPADLSADAALSETDDPQLAESALVERIATDPNSAAQRTLEPSAVDNLESESPGLDSAEQAMTAQGEDLVANPLRGQLAQSQPVQAQPVQAQQAEIPSSRYSTAAEADADNVSEQQLAITPNANLRFTSPNTAATGETTIQQEAPTAVAASVASAAEVPAQAVAPSMPRTEPPIQVPREIPLAEREQIAVLEPEENLVPATPLAAAPLQSEHQPLAVQQIPPGVQQPPAQTAISPADQPVAAPGVYSIELGDNFWVISEKLYGTDAYFKALFEHNRNAITDPNRLRPGGRLAAPPLAELRRLYPQLCPAQHSAGAEAVATTQTPAPLATRPTAVTPVAAPLKPGGTYVSADGDTLYDIARNELGDGNLWPQIYHLNRQQLGDDLDYLEPGTQLVMPASPAGVDNPRTQLTQQPLDSTRR